MTRYFQLSIAILFLCAGTAQSETEFQKLDRAYSQKKAKENLELNSLYLTKLKELKTKTKSGEEVIQIDKKIAVLNEENRQFQTQLSSSFNLTNTPAKVKSDYNFQPFAVGEKMIRFKKHTWIAIAPEFEKGYDISYVAEKKTPLKFSVTSAGVVSLAIAPDEASNLLKAGWKEVAKNHRQPGSKDNVLIYQKYLNTGDYTFPCTTLFGIRLLQRK